MESQPQWGEVIRIMVTGFGAVCVIMMMLAVVTSLVGKLIRKLEKPREEKEGAS